MGIFGGSKEGTWAVAPWSSAHTGRWNVTRIGIVGPKTSRYCTLFVFGLIEQSVA